MLSVYGHHKCFIFSVHVSTLESDVKLLILTFNVDPRAEKVKLTKASGAGPLTSAEFIVPLQAGLTLSQTRGNSSATRIINSAGFARLVIAI